jgi:Na+/proline symporter
LKEHVFDMYEAIPGFIGGMLLIITVSLLTSKSDQSLQSSEN